ncbi:hypothetical protein [Kamptonema sp. UHCC 0994]|uniref:hypothetical protein n=1 Tax=Kamptonema sp. UHCC 0994 TaxID=3031329 RepID=UPI0023B9168F|nr:hypothetical protein [Kamptonema sp. UHCC 0994]MDF0554129.1 hypothetical protein [Kamptonema sp. UHCC 0994]
MTISSHIFRYVYLKIVSLLPLRQVLSFEFGFDRTYAKLLSVTPPSWRFFYRQDGGVTRSC